MENIHVKEAVNIIFPNISKFNVLANIKGLLLRSLASVVYHSEILSHVIISQPGHPFAQIHLLNKQDLLTELKSLLSIKPSSKINSPTGIPPHVKMMSQVTDIWLSFRPKEMISQTFRTEF